MTATPAPAGRTRPRRRVQLLVWVLFTAALLAGFSLSGYRQASTAPTRPAAVSTLAAGTSSLTLAADGPAGADTAALRKSYCADPGSSDKAEQQAARAGTCVAGKPDALLPAYRWSSALSLPTDLGPLEKQGDIQNLVAMLLFDLASWTWVLLLDIVKMAVGTSLISLAGAQIDQAFSAAASGLGVSGLPLAAVMIAAAIGAMRVLRGKMSQAISIIAGATLVVGGMTWIAASADASHAFNLNGRTYAGTNVGSPAFLAKTGDGYLTTVVNDLTTGFGRTQALTSTVQNGTFATSGDNGGATCGYYVGQLYATYHNYQAKSGDSSNAMAADSLSLVSFMWQRGLYDNWTVALFGDLSDGSRIACHQLETNEGIQPLEQYALVGGGDNGTSAPKGGAYNGIAIGPFIPNTDKKDNQAATFAWAACGGADGQQPRAGWDEAAGVLPQNCKDWYTYSPGKESYGQIDQGLFDFSTVGINQDPGRDGRSVLEWKSDTSVTESTTWHPGRTSTPAQLDEVATTVLSYYGHNGGQRILSGLVAMISAGLYLWAFGAAALGTIATQIGLLFFLSLLPYTLMLLAFPNKDGGRSKLGLRMLKMTGTFFGGKAVFTALMGVTIQLMGMLFTVAASFTGSGSATAAAGTTPLAMLGTSGGSYTFMSMLIPGVTIFVLRAACKGLGLGDLTSLSGAAGFATSALMSGKENRKARNGLQGAFNGSVAGKALGKADAFAKSYATPGGALGRYQKLAQKQSAKHEAAAAQRKKQAGAQDAMTALANGELSPQLAAAVASGQMSMFEATARQKGLLNDQTAGLWRDGTLSAEDAAKMTKLMAPKEPEGEPKALGGYDGTTKRLEGMAGDDDDSHAPTYRTDLTGGADAEQLRTAAAERRNVLDVTTKDVDGDQWLDHATAQALDTMNQLRAGAQQLEVGRSLTPAEVTRVKADMSAATGIPVDHILFEDSGLPPMIAPLPRDSAGQLIVPELDNEKAQLALMMNPANFMDLHKAEGETVGQFHMRAVMEMVAAGVMDAGTGDVADLFKGHGVDIETANGREEVLRIVTGESSTVSLKDLAVAVPHQDRLAINAVVAEHYPRAVATEQVAQVQQVASVQSLSTQATDRAIRVEHQINASVQAVHEFQAGSPEMARGIDAALRKIEDSVSSVCADLGAIRLEADTTAHWVGDSGVDVSELVRAAGRLAETGKEDIARIGHDIANMSANVKLAPPELQPQLLEELGKHVADVMAKAREGMTSEVESMLSRAAEDARTRQEQMASQHRAAPRGSDFAGGASDIPT